MAEAPSKTDPRRHRPTAEEGPIMVDTSHQGKVFYFLGTFQVELYNRLENWEGVGEKEEEEEVRGRKQDLDSKDWVKVQAFSPRGLV